MIYTTYLLGVLVTFLLVIRQERKKGNILESWDDDDWETCVVICGFWFLALSLRLFKISVRGIKILTKERKWHL